MSPPVRTAMPKKRPIRLFRDGGGDYFLNEGSKIYINADLTKDPKQLFKTISNTEELEYHPETRKTKTAGMPKKKAKKRIFKTLTIRTRKSRARLSKGSFITLPRAANAAAYEAENDKLRPLIKRARDPDKKRQLIEEYRGNFENYQKETQRELTGIKLITRALNQFKTSNDLIQVKKEFEEFKQQNQEENIKRYIAARQKETVKMIQDIKKATDDPQERIELIERNISALANIGLSIRKELRGDVEFLKRELRSVKAPQIEEEEGDAVFVGRTDSGRPSAELAESLDSKPEPLRISRRFKPDLLIEPDGKEQELEPDETQQEPVIQVPRPDNLAPPDETPEMPPADVQGLPELPPEEEQPDPEADPPPAEQVPEQAEALQEPPKIDVEAEQEDKQPTPEQIEKIDAPIAEDEAEPTEKEYIAELLDFLRSQSAVIPGIGAALSLEDAKAAIAEAEADAKARINSADNKRKKDSIRNNALAPLRAVRQLVNLDGLASIKPNLSAFFIKNEAILGKLEAAQRQLVQKKRGSGSNKDGLHEDELKEYLAETIENNHPSANNLCVRCVDEIADAKLKRGKINIGIFNTLRRDDPETMGHWCVICMDDRPFSRAIEIYDPLADYDYYKDELRGALKAMLEKNKIPYLVKVKLNGVRDQRINSDTCGIHSLLFVAKRLNAPRMKDILTDSISENEAIAKSLKQVLNDDRYGLM